MPLAFFRDIPPSGTVAPLSAAPAVAAINAAAAPAAPAAPISAAAQAATAAPVPATAFAPAAPAAVAAPLLADATPPARRPQGPMFESLYQGDDGAPVGSVVRELWGARRVAAVETPQAVAPTAAPAAAGGAGVNAPLDLGQFMRPSARHGA
jgi:hypothetical protein